MAKRNGGIIGPSNVPSPFIAKGVWKLSDAFNYQKAGSWPIPLGYQIPNSCRFNSGSSDYLSRTPATNGTRTTWTYSFWLKKTKISASNKLVFSAGSPNNDTICYFQTDETIHWFNRTSSSMDATRITSQVFRDISAWYHFVFVWDTTNATALDRMKIYLNGVQITSFSSTLNPSSSLNSFWNSANAHQIMSDNNPPSETLDGYLSEVNFIDGQALTPSSFGQTDSATGIWTPLAYTGSFGTNGFYLKFANSAALGTDSSGNGNTWTANNLTSVDQSTDTCTNNFATMNPLKLTSDATFSNGNLTVLYGTSATRTVGQGTIGVSSGKWFWENKISGSVSPNNAIVGITSNSDDTDTVIGTSSNNFGYRGYDGAVYNNNSSVASLSTFTDGDIIGIALDLTNNLIYFYKNGTIQNSGTGISISGATNTSGFWYPAISDAGSSATPQFDMNFGSPPYSANSYTDANGFGNFSYAVPSGYYSLNTKNLAVYG